MHFQKLCVLHSWCNTQYLSLPDSKLCNEVDLVLLKINIYTIFKFDSSFQYLHLIQAFFENAVKYTALSDDTFLDTYASERCYR